MPDPFAAPPQPTPPSPTPRPTRAYTVVFWFTVLGLGIATFGALVAVATLLATARPVRLVRYPLPPIPAVTDTADWKMYRDEQRGIAFHYPPKLSVKMEAGGILRLSHAVTFRHPDPCDLRGSGPDGGPRMISQLVDFNVTLFLNNSDLHETMRAHMGDWSNEYWNGEQPKIIPGFIEPFTVNDKSGYMVTMGVEGCGVYNAYLPLSNHQTLIVTKAFVPELSGDITGWEVNRKLPGVIQPTEANGWLRQIISTFKLNEPTSEPARWQTYRNDRFGYELRYPANAVEIVLDNVLERGTAGNPGFRIKAGGHFALGVWGEQEFNEIMAGAYRLGSRREEIIVGGQPATRYVDEDLCDITWVVIPRGAQRYTFGGEFCDRNPASTQTFNSIVATFKFTEPAADTTGWQTYTNTKWSYEFKYPANVGSVNEYYGTCCTPFNDPASDFWLVGTTGGAVLFEMGYDHATRHTDDPALTDAILATFKRTPEAR